VVKETNLAPPDVLMPHRRRRKHKQKVEDDEYRERDTADAGHANNPRPLSYVTAIVLLCYIAFFLLQRTASNKGIEPFYQLRKFKLKY
jgi:hypothetical protein